VRLLVEGLQRGDFNDPEEPERTGWYSYRVSDGFEEKELLKYSSPEVHFTESLAAAAEVGFGKNMLIYRDAFVRFCGANDLPVPRFWKRKKSVMQLQSGGIKGPNRAQLENHVRKIIGALVTEHDTSLWALPRWAAEISTRAHSLGIKLGRPITKDTRALVRALKELDPPRHDRGRDRTTAKEPSW